MVGHRRAVGKPLGSVSTLRRRRAAVRARAGGDWASQLAAAFDLVRASLRDLQRRDPDTAAEVAAELARHLEGAAADIDRHNPRRKAG